MRKDQRQERHDLIVLIILPHKHASSRAPTKKPKSRPNLTDQFGQSLADMDASPDSTYYTCYALARMGAEMHG